ncbi:nitrogen fixation protein NifQ [Azospirillum argentinense]|uniref:Nitrogen fixation protein NifQ n=1 Tax=Azospirillum argentinense TaxID=2970906 RepID=A0ABW8V493_9PROT
MDRMSAQDRLMAWSRTPHAPDTRDLARILLHRCSGRQASYVHGLGLEAGALAALIDVHFPAAAAGWTPGTCFSDHVKRLGGVRCGCAGVTAAVSREEGNSAGNWLLREERDFRDLLMRHRLENDASALPLADVIARACLENDHLWRSLGLADRPHLAALLARHFPSLAEANTRKLRWKRFFYECLWAEGRPVSRSTVCDACLHQAECYDGTASFHQRGA